MFTPTILIDLDGVLNEYGKEKFDENFIPSMKKGAKEFLEKRMQKNPKIDKFLRFFKSDLRCVKTSLHAG